ncbi:RNA polymerase sigma-54 factor [Thiosulfatimonas sediminis]|uniref:RNA polymerase sigma-54 factor n=1 Tax=Thiosulfatimonas sediminis TaxID=2675054 RepID=A0A6F8PVC2_9GAMM|nr:RNA polymerase factor sigma-54 [Thiosulfatimonas sediminis]BBP45954.1 RNA polymerase sigma-54 factor [Thiosulfatimonas sediminis]
MALMPGLQLNIGQQLKLTPQLQQSIKILQYSALEVQQTIETTLETNFMLEIEEERDDERDDLEAARETEDKRDLEETLSAEEKPLDIEHNNEIDSELQMDMEWDEVFSDHSAPSNSPKDPSEYVSAENYTSAETTLHDHLQWQLDTAPFDERQIVLASYLIDDINDEGYLSTELSDLLATLNDNESEGEQPAYSLQELEAVLVLVQQFEPNGVGARSLQESLLLQLAAMPQKPYVVSARQLIKENFDWLSYHDHKRIKKFYGLNDDELTTLLRLIQTLNPRPGRDFSPTQSEMIIPDLRLKRSKSGWLVELNQDAFPRLGVNATYIQLASSLDDSEQNKRIKEQLTEAKGLIKSIQSRGETLLRVGSFIVNRQQGFFEEGEQAMKPLVLREVAEFLDLHESTISRATNQKYIQTPRGTFELKYFFSTGVSQYGSADQSATAIKAFIKRLIDAEDPKKPLSDSKLMKLLEEDNEISVARRTIAKYREAMNIPSSSERKKLNTYKI